MAAEFGWYRGYPSVPLGTGRFFMLFAWGPGKERGEPVMSDLKHELMQLQRAFSEATAMVKSSQDEDLLRVRFLGKER